MSQKRIKRLKKQDIVVQKNNVVRKEVLSVRGILRENWKFLLVLCVGVFFLYFNSLHGDFVSDDYAGITQNPLILDFVYTFKTVNLASVCNTLVAIVAGIGSPIPFHLLSLILYLAICLAAFIFIYLLLKNKNLSMLVITLFALLPIHVEVVSWISGKPYLLVSLFILISLDSLILYLANKKTRYLWVIAISLFFLFLADRVRGSALVFLTLLYLFIYGKKVDLKFKLGKVLLVAVVLMSVLTIISWPMIMVRINAVNSGINISDSIFYSPFFQYPTAIAKYLQLLFVPTDLTLYHTMYILPIWLNWSILFVYIFLLIYFFIKNKNIFFALAFIFLATAPSMAPVKVSWLVAERYVFLGSLGFCLFLVLVFEPLAKRFKYLLLSLFVLLVGVYSIRVYLRNIDWQTNHNLWVNTCQTSPNSHNAWNNIGDDYDKLKQYDNAIRGFTQSTVVKPNYADAYHNRANIFYKMGRLDLARDSYNTALYYSPQLFQTYMSLTQIDFVERRFDLAVQHAQKAAQMQPNNPQTLYVLGVVYANAGMREEAKKILTPLVQQYPQFKQASDILNQLSGS